MTEQNNELIRHSAADLAAKLRKGQTVRITVGKAPPPTTTTTAPTTTRATTTTRN